MESPEMNSPNSNRQAPEATVEETVSEGTPERKADTTLRSALEISNAGQGQIEQKYNATTQTPQQETTPEVQTTETPLRTATEIAMAGQGQIEQKYNATTQTPQQETIPEVQTTETPLRTATEIAMAEQGQIEQKYKDQEQPIQRDLHQEALDSNRKANEIPSVEETLRAGKPEYNLRVERTSGEIEDGWVATGVFQDQSGVEKVRVWKESPDGLILRKDVKLEDISQWNKNTGGLSAKGQQSLEVMDEIQRDLQGKSFKESLAELMEEEDAQRYLGFLARDLPKDQVESTKPSETPSIQEVFADIDQKLSQSKERISEIDIRIGEINNKLIEIQGSASLTQEQLLEHMSLSQELQGLMTQKFEVLLEQQRLNSEKSNALYKDLLDKIEKGRQPEIPPTPEVPITRTSSAETDQLQKQAQENSKPTGENTPEQRSAAISRQLAELDAIKKNRPLTDQEKIQYFDLLESKKTIDTQLQNVEKENARKRNRKHTIIKVGAFVAGAGVGALTPPVSAAALIAVGLGGPILGRQGIKLSEKLRAKSNSLKYIDRGNKTATELAQIDKKIKRNEWWANRLGEVSSALMGAGAGYGAGKTVQNIVNMLRTPSTPPVAEGTPSGQQGEPPQAPPTEEVTPPQGSVELPPSQTGVGTGSELSSGDWLRTGELGWDTSKWGWKGPDLFVPQGGVVEGAVPDLQGKFLKQLSELGVTRAMLRGQQAGEIFNQGLRNTIYTSGSNLQEVASATAEALRNLNS